LEGLLQTRDEQFDEISFGTHSQAVTPLHTGPNNVEIVTDRFGAGDPQSAPLW